MDNVLSKDQVLLDDLIPDIVAGYIVVRSGEVYSPEGKRLLVKLNGKQPSVQFRRYKGVPIKMSIIKVLAIAFLGVSSDEKVVIKAMDGDPYNWQLANIRIGASVKDSRQVQRIHNLLTIGMSVSQIAVETGFSKAYVYKVRQQWLLDCEE